MAYGFGGVFTFTMYGVTEATDSMTVSVKAQEKRVSSSLSGKCGGLMRCRLCGLLQGQPYTDYILQCQWGPTPEDLTPWVVARRSVSRGPPTVA
jgi:hypothetical protein